MLPQINVKLLRAKERIQAKRRLEARLADVQRQVLEQEQRCSRNGQLLGSAQVRVAKLEGASLTSAFFTILGTKTQRLEKENQEYLSAQLKHAEAVEAVQFAQAEFDELEQKLTEYRDAESEYSDLVEEKHRLLIEARDPRSDVLDGLADRLVNLGADRLKIQEAMQTGATALVSLERIRAELRSAEDVSVSEELGGVFQATKLELSKIDAASQHLQTAERLLRKFQEDLVDVSLRLHVATQIDMFFTVAKSFFNGSTENWVVKSKIQAASSACGITIAAVTGTLAECERQLVAVEQKIEAAAAQRRHYIEEA